MTQDSLRARPRLVGDIGGTNARFAWQAHAQAPLECVETLPCQDYPQLQQAVEAYLDRIRRERPAQAALGLANPVTGDWVQMTNNHWAFSTEAMRQALGLHKLAIYNDFSALALALPTLRKDELLHLGGGPALPDAARALIGPGTGLGVSGLLPQPGGGWRALESEGGHASLCAASEREWQVLGQLQRRFGHASAERVLSGPGLVWTYEALCALDGVPPRFAQPPELADAALAQTDAWGVEALTLFFGFLGAVAGNLALTLGARGGVYLGGGVLPRMAEALQASGFMERFLAKGRMRPLLQSMPVYLITAQESPALRGMALAMA
ncbi:glucokinase [Mitsuaria sp. WAJ17]|uniref:glucokinase n=1 Tax=Mitsuaria sp. WAJ17 TaxID=2761452 RepID=UPI0016007C3C|nr:glucokinase [Mitsuaria sp. WAJ17]MBB2485890.1 glucokinase [Mitsuaria sp. WAJ17]